MLRLNLSTTKFRMVILRICYRVTSLASLSAGRLDSYPDGAFITGCQDKLIRIFDSIGTLTKLLVGHEKGVISFSWTPECFLLSGSWDGTCRLWDISSGSCVHVFTSHENGVNVLYLDDRIITTSTGEQVDIILI